jgi:hypothetical protein
MPPQLALRETAPSKKPVLFAQHRPLFSLFVIQKLVWQSASPAHPAITSPLRVL